MQPASRVARSAPPLLRRGIASKAAAVKEVAAAWKSVTEKAMVSGNYDASDAGLVKKTLDSRLGGVDIDFVRTGAVSAVVASAENFKDAVKPVKSIAVTGMKGENSDALAEALYWIASGSMCGYETPVSLQLDGGDAALIDDIKACGFPLLKDISTGGPKGADYVIAGGGDVGKLAAGTLVGAIGNGTAAAIQKASPGAIVTAITMQHQLTGQVEVAKAANGGSGADVFSTLGSTGGVTTADVTNVIVWGEGVIDLSHAMVKGTWVKAALPNLPTFVDANAAQPAHEVGRAISAHMSSLALGSFGKWVSMGVPAVGDYGMGEGFFYSVPVVCYGEASKSTMPEKGSEPVAGASMGVYRRVGGISLSPESAEAMEKARLALSA